MTSQSTKQQTVSILQQDFGFKTEAGPPPSFDTKELETTIISLKIPVAAAPGYPCATQHSLPEAQAKPETEANPLHRIWLGLDNEIPRWRPGSVVNYTISLTGWPSPQHYNLAAQQLFAAAQEWNSHNVGVQFRYVYNIQDACFMCIYGGNMPYTYAIAFFPNANDLNFINVYDFSFTPREIHKLKNVFLHELGHVLGLRHEFAATEGRSATPFGVPNPMSVMNYTDTPTIQQSDIISTRQFYGITGGYIGRYPIRDYIPDN